MFSSQRSLIIRADDAGSAPGVNRAIRRALRAGSVTAVGFMAVGPAFEDAVNLLQGELGEADIGVHATLNAEWSTVRWGPKLSPNQVPSLVDARGHFFPTPRELASQLKLEEAVAEIRAQIRAVREAGLTPVYLDTHMGVDRLPELEPALRALAHESELLFVAREPAYVRTESRPLARNCADTWLQALAQLPGGRYQLVTHPATDTKDVRGLVHAGLAPGQIARERSAETEALCAPEFRSELANLGVQLAHFTSPC